MPDERKDWLIFEGRSGLFWRENRCGYGDLSQAGLYTKAEAKLLAKDPSRQDRAHHVSEYRARITEMEANGRRLRAALDGTGESRDV